MSGFQFSTASRIGASSFWTPSVRTSCPLARSVVTTSYSVFQTLISLLAVTFERIGRHQVGMHQHQDAERLHSANHCRRDGL